jgi:hypothetical protein
MSIPNHTDWTDYPDSTVYMSSRDNYTASELSFYGEASAVFTEASGSTVDKLQTFTRFVPRQAIATFMARQHLFNLVKNVHGYIIECGVFRGSGLFAWGQLSAIYEPYNHTRRIIGFDSFSGFSGLSKEDGDTSDLPYKQVGGLSCNPKDEIERSIQAYDKNRFISQIPRIELVEGDAVTTIPHYVDNNNHLIIALLYLDFDVYEPTRIAIENFWPRMPIGSVIAFDELNQKQWPGETQALMDTLSVGSLEIKRFDFNPQISYAVKK